MWKAVRRGRRLWWSCRRGGDGRFERPGIAVGRRRSRRLGCGGGHHHRQLLSELGAFRPVVSAIGRPDRGWVRRSGARRAGRGQGAALTTASVAVSAAISPAARVIANVTVVVATRAGSVSFRSCSTFFSLLQIGGEIAARRTQKRAPAIPGGWANQNGATGRIATINSSTRWKAGCLPLCRPLPAGRLTLPVRHKETS